MNTLVFSIDQKLGENNSVRSMLQVNTKNYIMTNAGLPKNISYKKIQTDATDISPLGFEETRAIL